ncbi:hypothetical protein [Allobaculum mucilyticum]|uniref:hypothetical protein n=1 Tax=Allobaculum mucilyticum TaxID=2834459 RepID=UPI001E360A15|nr:hypothetical protein [Allobaculum mucilyticum]UNT96578.1 hypothetical protein KWG62_02105 [Allobaculum mucilyticum]
MGNSRDYQILKLEALKAINPFGKIYSSQTIRVFVICLLFFVILCIWLIYQTVNSAIRFRDSVIGNSVTIIYAVISTIFMWTTYRLAKTINTMRFVQSAAKIIESEDPILHLSPSGIIIDDANVIPFNTISYIFNSKNLYVIAIENNSVRPRRLSIGICPKTNSVDLITIAKASSIKVIDGFHQSSL